MFCAKSLDNLSITTCSSTSQSTQDPFDTTNFWTTSQNSPIRPNYDFQPNNSSLKLQKPEESPKYSKYSSLHTSHIYNNTLDRSHSSLSQSNASAYSVFNNSSVNNTLADNSNASAIDSNIRSLTEMSLDDRISESLNLRSKLTNNENIYANHSVYNGTEPSTSTSLSHNPPTTTNDKKYDDGMPIYGNFEINPKQSQFILETKDYYTKLSTAIGVRNRNDYEKNIYVPKYEDEGEKLKNFSEGMENSKNYSAIKYQVPEYYQNNFVGEPSRTAAMYDEVNDTASNLYSEIGEASNGVYTNARFYDEVYESATPRPHRPAPPCPAKPK